MLKNVLFTLVGLLLISCGEDSQDDAPPMVVQAIPAKNAQDVALDAIIEVAFDEPIDTMSISNNTIMLSSSLAGNVAGSVSYDATTVTLRFEPNNLLMASTSYDVLLSKEITDQENNHYEGEGWSFTTTGDKAGPHIINRSPTIDEVDVSIETILSVQFDEPLDISSVTNQSIVLTQDQDQINGTLAYDGDDFKLQFAPTDPLVFNRTYTVELSSQLTDTAANAIDPETWSFNTVSETAAARYEVTFNATWSSSSHPINFPTNAHFSGLIGMTHSAGTDLFSLDELATNGIKDMAELGSKKALIAEIEEKMTAGEAQFLLSGGGVAISPGSVVMEFDMEVSHPMASIVSMIAPSPDWFVGAKAVNLYQDGQWLDEVTVEVGSYDAGTDSGSSYTSANEVTNPPVNISVISDQPLAVDGEVAPLGSMTFIRIN